MTALRDGEYKAPFSVLDMLPHLREAANDFIAFKKEQGTGRRRLNADEDFSDISPENNDPENADEEIIIDPTEMPDTWGDEGDAFLDPINDGSSDCVGVLVDITNNVENFIPTLRITGG